MATTRRIFLYSAAAASQARPSGSPTLPTVEFLGRTVTRLIVGSNPLYGYSHFNPIYDATMREWMTQDRRLAVLHRAEECGINTWQCHYNPQFVEDFHRYRGEGGKMNLFLLGHGELMTNAALLKEAAKLDPVGVAHHGNMTDDRFRAGEMGKVKDWMAAVRDAGMKAGISTHNPAVIDYVEGKGWDVSYYMTCMYRVSRTPDEARQEFGEAPMGEIYMERDPDRMTKMVRATKRPCLAFKIFAAGRAISSPQRVEQAMRFVYANIKPGDAVIVGMFPRFKDEPAENTALARKILAERG